MRVYLQPIIKNSWCPLTRFMLFITIYWTIIPDYENHAQNWKVVSSIFNLYLRALSLSCWYNLPLISTSCRLIACEDMAYVGMWELHCALPQWYRTTLCTTLCTCVVHHDAQGGLCQRDIFHFMMVHMEHAQNGPFLSVFGGAQEHTTYTFLGGGTPYMVHSA